MSKAVIWFWAGQFCVTDQPGSLKLFCECGGLQELGVWELVQRIWGWTVAVNGSALISAVLDKQGK